MSRTNGDKARYHRQRKARAKKRNQWRQLRQGQRKNKNTASKA